MAYPSVAVIFQAGFRGPPPPVVNRVALAWVLDGSPAWKDTMEFAVGSMSSTPRPRDRRGHRPRSVREEVDGEKITYLGSR